MTLGDNIKKIRKEKKLTQQQLSDVMGISRSYLSDVENGRYNPSSKTIESFAKKLDVSMFYLTTGEKALSDLAMDESKEIIQETFEYMKKEIQEVASSELTAYELNYLSAMVRFLKKANKDEVVGLTLISVGLNRYIDYKKDSDLSKDELNHLLKNTSNEVIDFLYKYFFNHTKEGE